jgi:glutathione S-transferase
MLATMAKLVLCEVTSSTTPGLESRSPFCLKIHRALRVAGLPYTSRFGKIPADFKALNPTGQVPVLLVDGEPVYDSTRILARILELAPHALLARHPEAWLWEDYADRALNGYLVAARWIDGRNWPRVRDAYFGEAPWLVRTVVAPSIRRKIMGSLVARDFLRGGEVALWDDYRRILDALEKRAPHEGFWLGERLSVADLGLFGQLQSLRSDLTPWQSREIALRPVLTDWLDRVDGATRGDRPVRSAAPRPVEAHVS